MTLEVYSFDFDGCLFNYTYLSSKERDLIATNKELFDLISKSKNKKTTFISSNRQSIADDHLNAAQDNRGSCYSSIDQVNKAIGADFDPLLLTDIYNNLAPGTSIKTALKCINKRTNEYESKQVEKYKSFPNWIHDSSKLTVLYAQMHKIAFENPTEQIEFIFIDDREDILVPLQEYLLKYSDLIPPNLTLRLQCYKGPFNREGLRNEPLITEYLPIKGTRSEADKDYKQTVKNMAAVTIEQMSKAGHDITSQNPSAQPIGTYMQAEQANFNIGAINSIKYYTPGMIAEHPVSAALISDSKKKLQSLSGFLFRQEKTSTSQQGSDRHSSIEMTTLSSSESTPNLSLVLDPLPIETNSTLTDTSLVRKNGSGFFSNLKKREQPVKKSTHRRRSDGDDNALDKLDRKAKNMSTHRRKSDGKDNSQDQIDRTTINNSTL